MYLTNHVVVNVVVVYAIYIDIQFHINKKNWVKPYAISYIERTSSMHTYKRLFLKFVENNTIYIESAYVLTVNVCVNNNIILCEKFNTIESNRPKYIKFELLFICVQVYHQQTSLVFFLSILLKALLYEAKIYSLTSKRKYNIII